jgi:hypothetical protein
MTYEVSDVEFFFFFVLRSQLPAKFSRYRTPRRRQCRATTDSEYWHYYLSSR